MRRILPYLFLLLILFFPSSNLERYDGLPLSSWPEFIALAFLAAFLIFPPLRQGVDSIFQKCRLLPAAFWILGAAALAVKIVLLISGARDGFAGCYGSPAQWAPAAGTPAVPGECERSYEDLFRRTGATRLDGAVQFGKDVWNLVFLNTSRYDYYDWLPGVIPRDRIPLSVRWTGRVDLAAGTQLRIQYAGEGLLQLGDLIINLPPFYDTVGQVTVDAPGGRQDLTLYYLFNDGSRTGSGEALGPRAQIRVWQAGGQSQEPLRAERPAGGWIALAALGDILILVCLLSLAPALWVEIRPQWLIPAVFCGYALLWILLPLPAWAREAGVTAGLVAFWIWILFRKPARPLAVYLVIGMAGLAITRFWLPAIDQVLVRSAGNDPLGFESQSYAILATGSPEGGEAVFYAQPMFRYIRFLEHAVFGDGDALPAAAELILFFGAAFFLFAPAAGLKHPPWRKLILMLAGAGVLFLGGYCVSAVIRDGLPEYTTWSLLLLALPLLFLADSTPAVVCGFAALALSFTVRANQLPAILWIMLLAGLRLRRINRKAVVIGLIAALCIGLLPLAHNLIYGRAFVLTTTSAGTSSNLTLPPETWLAFFRGDSAAADAVRGQVGMLFLISDWPRSQWPTLATLLLFLATWIVLIASLILRRLRGGWALALVPAFYLAPHFFYVVNTYYPRHIVIAYLAMAAVIFILFARHDLSLPDAPAPAERPGPRLR